MKLTKKQLEAISLAFTVLAGDAGEYSPMEKENAAACLRELYTAHLGDVKTCD